MNGSNKLHLNMSEMIRALEFYLNEVQFKEPISVSDINESKTDSVFIIHIEEHHPTVNVIGQKYHED